MLEYLGFRIAASLVWLIPFRLMYIISDGLAFLFEHMIRYRREIVIGNFKRSFPEKSHAEIRHLAHLYYQHLTDITLESLKGMGISRKDLLKRYHFVNPELINKEFAAGRNVIAMPAHYGNWEWGVLSFPIQVDHQVLGVYKPLRNKYSSHFADKRRTRFGLQLCPIQETRNAFLREDWEEPVLFIMMADQSPSNPEKAHWVGFLNQDTACLQGTDRWARQRNYPVFFMDTQRVKRGFYEITFHLLSDQPEKTEEETITRAYMKSLEAVIQENPAPWLWSHRRWKRKLPEGKRVFGG